MMGLSDIYISCFSVDGTNLLSSTYIGGMGYESSMIGHSSIYDNLGVQTIPINPLDLTFDKLDNVWVSSNSGSKEGFNNASL
jgi:hypothetical protein